MAFLSVGLFLRPRARLDPTVTTVVANVGFCDIGDPYVVGVVDNGGIYMIHVGVIGEVIALPAAAFVSKTPVAEAVIDAAIEAHLRAPISFMEKERTIAPAPITRGPEEAHLWRFYPRTGHPVIAVVIVVGPVTGRPKIAVVGTDGLVVDGKWRRAEANGNANTDLSERTVGKSQQDKRKKQQANRNCSTHFASFCPPILNMARH